ncbi:AsmA family protein [Rhodopirellula sp. SWK7]|uniref:AsmA family protein n=1 Tax=Rhodopirellula sp. SWK7 TaxID=595460 RepID=UPI0002BF1E37|nr:AsmA-like C-terminal region-containing protein [Rhodopirellula sp. SWK7]EMI40508.1 putative secreted protein [Rhodopirellula sp. SWK7]
MRYLLLTCLLVLSPTVSLAQQKPNPAPPVPAQPKYWTTNWSFDDIDIGKMADRLGKIGIETGLEMQGTVSVHFEVGIPINALRDGAAYRFDGTLTSPSLVIDGVLMNDLRTTVTYRDGVATLEDLSSMVVDKNSKQQSSGSVKGKATVGLVPRKDVTAEITVTDLAIAPLANLLAKYLGQSNNTLPSDGSFSGDVNFRVPLKTVSDITTYQLDGTLSGRGLRVANLPPADFDARRVRIEDKKLLIENFSLDARANNRSDQRVRLLGNANLPLSTNGDFEIELLGDDIPVGTVAGLFANQNEANSGTLVRGKLDFRVTGSGRMHENLEQSNWNVRGSLASPQLSIAGVDLGTIEHHVELTSNEFNIVPIRDTADLPKSFRIGELKSRYSISDETLRIEQIDATIFDGRLSGSATMPFSESGTVLANFDIANIQPRIELPVAGRRVSMSAAFDGNVDWQVPLASVDQPSTHQGQFEFSLSNATIGEAAIGNLQGSASVQSGDISLSAKGKFFDGTVAVQTTANMQANDRWSDLPTRLATSKIEFNNVSLHRFYEVATGSRIDLTGLASGNVTVNDWHLNSGPGWQLPSAEIRLTLSRVSHRSRLLSRSMRLDGRLRKNAFEIVSLVGDYADGDARVRGRVYLFDEKRTMRPRADLHASASRINLAKGLWFLGDVANDFQGRASLSATISGYHDSIRLRGNADGRDLVLYGLPLGNAHSGLAADANVTRQSWQLRFPSVRSRQGGGQVDGELSLASTRRGGRGVDLESRWHTRRVDFVRLTQQLGQSTSVAKGEITGDLTLNGNAIESVDDLTGRFRFALGQTRGAAIPGLIGVSRFLGPVSLVNQRFDVGEAKGVIGAGAVTFDEFWVGSDNALVQADGRVYIRSGRMNLNALIATGDYRDIAANFTQLAQQYALRSLLPASAILDVSELLRDRTLVVNVIGTLQDPIVRVQPVQTFREEAARFLLREGQRLILTGITAGTIDSLDGK